MVPVVKQVEGDGAWFTFCRALEQQTKQTNKQTETATKKPPPSTSS